MIATYMMCLPRKQRDVYKHCFGIGSEKSLAEMLMKREAAALFHVYRKTLSIRFIWLQDEFALHTLQTLSETVRRRLGHHPFNFRRANCVISVVIRFGHYPIVSCNEYVTTLNKNGMRKSFKIWLTTLDCPMKSWNVSNDIAYLLPWIHGTFYNLLVEKYSFKISDNIRFLAGCKGTCLKTKICRQFSRM